MAANLRRARGQTAEIVNTLGLSIPAWPGMSASLETQCKTK